MVITKRFHRKYFYISVIALLPVNFFLLSICVGELVHLGFSPKIHTQTQLEDVLNKKRNELGIDPSVDIEARLMPFTYRADFEIISDNKYRMAMGGFYAKEAAVDHESYHIFDGHTSDRNNRSGLNFFRYLFWEEPQAALYQITGIKL